MPFQQQLQIGPIVDDGIVWGKFRFGDKAFITAPVDAYRVAVITKDKGTFVNNLIFWRHRQIPA